MTVALERAVAVDPCEVRGLLSGHLLVDGLDLVLDLRRSHGSWLVDARDGTPYLDLFTFFASSALGMNHPALAHDPAFRAELLAAALTKPSNSDVYTVAMARFVDTFARVLDLREAFHGRTGYTMSLTNTDPVKTARYPTFDWPRIDNPYVRADLTD